LWQQRRNVIKLGRVFPDKIEILFWYSDCSKLCFRVARRWFPVLWQCCGLVLVLVIFATTLHRLYCVCMWSLLLLEMNIWFWFVFQRILYCILCATIDVNHILFIYFYIYYCYHKCVIFNSYFAIDMLMLCAQKLPRFRKMHT
jgi:hypothetical protein